MTKTWIKSLFTFSLVLCAGLAWCGTYTWDLTDGGFKDSEGNEAVVSGDFSIIVEFTMPNVTAVQGDMIVFNAVKTSDGSSSGSFGMKDWNNGTGNVSAAKYLVGSTEMVTGGHYSNARYYSGGTGTNTMTMSAFEFKNGEFARTLYQTTFANGDFSKEYGPSGTFSDSFSFESVSLVDDATLVKATLVVHTDVISYCINNTTSDDNLSGLAVGLDQSTLVENKYWTTISCPAQGGANVNSPTLSSAVDNSGNIWAIGFSGTSGGFWSYDATAALGSKGNNYADGPWTMNFTNIPFTKYDIVLYMATDVGNKSWGAVQVGADDNAKYYIPSTEDPTVSTYDGVTSESTWGQTTPATAGFGTNVMRITDLTESDLTLKTIKPTDNTRAGLYGFQIVNRGEILIQTVDWTANTAVTNNISDLQDITLSTVRLLVAPDSVLKIDTAVDFSVLQLESTGSVTVLGVAESLGGLELLGATGVAGASVFEAENLINAGVSKLDGFDVVKKTGSAEETFESSAGLQGSQLVIENGTVVVNGQFQDILATEDYPITVSGEGSKIRFLGSDQRNRLPGNAFIRVESGGTVEFEGVNIFPDNNGPNIVLDNATMRAVATAGGHIKVKTVTMSNGSKIELAGSATAYNSEGLFLLPEGSAKITSIAGENTIQYAEGATQNKLKLQGGMIKVAEGASLTVDVLMSLDIVKSGAGLLKYVNTTVPAISVTEGLLEFDPGAGVEVEASAITTADAGGAVKISSGIVNLGSSRPRISEISGVAKFIMDASEQAAGLITVPTSLAEAPSTDSFVVYKTDGTTPPTWAEDNPVVLEDGYLKLNFVTLEPIEQTGNLSTSVTEASEGDLAVNGGEEGITLTFDIDLPEAVNLIISGKVTLKTSDYINELPSNLAIQEGAEVTIEAPFDGDFSLPANTTFILQGGADSEHQTAFGRFTVPENATLKTKGHLAVTLASNNGTFDVLDGVATVTAGGAQTVKGTLYVRKGAEFVNVTNDAVVYDNNIGGTIIYVYGVLNMNTSRWTVGGTCELHLYAGCEVKGTGDGDGIIDFFRGGEFVQVHPNPDDEDATTAVFSGLVRVRNNEAKVKIESGVYVNFNGGLGSVLVEGRKLTRTGAGGFIGTNYLKGVELDLGAHSGVKARFVSASGENKLIIEGSNANSFCGDDSKDDPVIKVEPGSTLTLAIKDYSGWNGNVTEHGWIVNNGTLKLTAKTAQNSRFFREHIVIGDGATTIVEQNTTDGSTERAQILYGGAPSEDLAQIQLPTGTATISTNGTAAAKVLYLGNDGTGSYGTKGAGISVGKGAELTLEPTIKGPDGITKWGDGNLTFVGPMDEYTGTLTLKGGTISIAPGCGFNGAVVTDVEMKSVSSKTESDGTVVYKLSEAYFFIRIR